MKEIDKEEIKERTFSFLRIGILSFILFSLIGILVFLVINLRNLPDIRNLENWKPSQVTKVYAKDGSLLTEFYIQKRQYVTIDKIPEHVRNAFIAIEDRTFYHNIGIDVLGIMRAFGQNLISGHIVAGGSTISQQLIKNLFLTPERSFSRKVKEMILAIKLNRMYPKDKILEMYLNQIYLGHGSYGVESASQTYFGKHVWELDVCEAAVLAGLPKAPSRYDPYYNMEGALERRNAVLKSMLEEGYITLEEANQCMETPITLKDEEKDEIFKDHFTELVRLWLIKKFGADAVYKGGYKVYTTLDKNLQKNAYAILRDKLDSLQQYVGFPELTEDEINNLLTQYEKQKVGKKLKEGNIYIALIKDLKGKNIKFKFDHYEGTLKFKGDLKELKKMLEKYPEGVPVFVRYLGNDKFKFIPYIEGSVIALDSHTGAIRVLVGGYDFKKNEFNRVVQTKRQPGSAFKPIVYTQAILDRYTQVSILKDEPLSFWDTDKNEEWIPQNYYNKYFGDVTLRYALTHSLNAASVYLLSQIGFDKVIPLAHKLGIKEHIPKVYSMVLGSISVSPLELATVYSTFGNEGIKCEPYFIEKVENYAGYIYYEHKQKCEEIIPPKENAIMVDMLKGVIKEGTGKKAASLGIPLAGKTGTTDEFTDAWFAGFSRDITAVVWVGYDTKKPMKHRVTGAKGALPVWMNLMATIYADKEALDFPLPEGVMYVPIDPETHLLANEHCPGKEILFIMGTEPDIDCEGNVAVPIPPLDEVDIPDISMDNNIKSNRKTEEKEEGKDNFIFDLN